MAIPFSVQSGKERKMTYLATYQTDSIQLWCPEAIKRNSLANAILSYEKQTRTSVGLAAAQINQEH